MELCPLKLDCATKLGNRRLEGLRCRELGDSYVSELSNFETAIDYYERYLHICKEQKDRAGEGNAYGKLGNAYNSVGKFDKASDNYELQRKIAIELGDRLEEARAVNSIGILNLFHCHGDLRKAVEYQDKYLAICKKVGNKSGEGHAYGYLGIAFHRLGDLEKAMEYHNQNVKIVMELGEKAEEGKAYGNMGRVYRSLRDFERAIEYHELQLSIAKGENRKADQAIAYYDLACNLESQELFTEARERYQSCAKLLYELRPRHRNTWNSTFNDEWKINLFDEYKHVYTDLCRVLSKLNLDSAALLAAEQGRGQALADFMEYRYGIEIVQPLSGEQEGAVSDIFRNIQANTVFLGIDTDTINVWLLVPGQDVRFGKRPVHETGDATTFLRTLIENACHRCRVMVPLRGFHSSLQSDTCLVEDENVYQSDTSTPHDVEKFDQKELEIDQNPFRTLYDIIFGPILEHLQGDELVIVPEGPLCMVPYAALVDPDSKYLHESFRIRVAPSLTSLKMITQGDHSESGALLVGDPWVAEIVTEGGHNLSQLPFARREVQMIGQLINVEPLLGKMATKMEVLNRIKSDALIHIAAHATSESGEIALAPNQTKLHELHGITCDASVPIEAHATPDSDEVPLTPNQTELEELPGITSDARTLIEALAVSKPNEIALAPNPSLSCQVTDKKDYMLTMAEVLNVQLRAKLVVLSCCHTAQGEIRAEGVVGIARAFLAAGARSVLVSLWAIDDEATFEFMKSFYQHLAEGNKASEALNKAMKCLRESDEFNEVRHWAPYVLIGDDVTLEFLHKPCTVSKHDLKAYFRRTFYYIPLLKKYNHHSC